MFMKWLDTQVIASWYQLLEALRSPSVDLVHLASKIDQMLDNENDYLLLLYWAGSSADYAQGTGFVPNNHNYSKLHIKIKI